MTRVYVAFSVLAAALIVASCDNSPQVDRSGRLLAMAGEEAANIPNKLDRFTRQLNIADTQLRTNRKGDAAKTLALARDTLVASSKAEFDDFHRIAGWTAVSQLSRVAGDKDLAIKASDNALAALNDTQPLTDRPQYVLSLTGELAELRGKQAAIELLESGSGWAAEIREPEIRRLALVTFAQRLISFDSFDNARNTLKRDPDAVWRTDTFLTLANQNAPMVPEIYYANMRQYPASDMASAEAGGGAGGAARSPMREAQVASMKTAAPNSPSFQQQIKKADAWSKDVRYESVFQQQR